MGLWTLGDPGVGEALYFEEWGYRLQAPPEFTQTYRERLAVSAVNTIELTDTYFAAAVLVNRLQDNPWYGFEFSLDDLTQPTIYDFAPIGAGAFSVTALKGEGRRVLLAFPTPSSGGIHLGSTAALVLNGGT